MTKSPSSFWAWIWETNDAGPRIKYASGRTQKPSKVSLSRRCGLAGSTFTQQETNRIYPTERQAKRMAHVLNLPFEEVQRRADLRRSQSDDQPECNDCPLPDCLPTNTDCPLYDKRNHLLTIRLPGPEMRVLLANCNGSKPRVPPGRLVAAAIRQVYGRSETP